MTSTHTLTAREFGRLPQTDRSTTAIDEGAFLRALGERVRSARSRSGMTRKRLAEESGVSERYLAQLETGHGNISVLLLQKVALALHLPLAAFLATEEGEQAAEIKLIHDLLSRIPTQQLPRVREQLTRKFGGIAADRRTRIALIGLRGAGKSTLGARLGKALSVPFIELDQEIECEAGTSLSEIFLLYGQAGYRRYERRCLERMLEHYDHCVLATGGSIVSEPATYDLLLSACFTVWLRARPEEHMARVVAQGDMRPMAGNKQAMDDLKRILDARAELYGRADAVVDTAGHRVERSLKDLEEVVSTSSSAAVRKPRMQTIVDPTR